MMQIHKTLRLPDNFYIQHYFSEGCAFFDIETTGFSPKNSFVYLIGLATRDKSAIHIYQFFAQNRSEEDKILDAFYQKLALADTLITFNGMGFDIPFLKGRETVHSIYNSWDSYQYIDLYKITGKLAHLLQLPNKKQKSVEIFLGIHREDIYTGGDLISKYYEYEKTRNLHNEELLLLHNYEDVLGMTKLLSLLSYRDLFEQPLNVINIKSDTYRPYGTDIDEQEILLELEVKIPFPKPFLYRGEYCTLRCENTSAKLMINVYCGELKFYYENYRDYYYLPEEDMAIHKSVAAFVDASHRKKATAATCYTRKSGYFLPQAEKLFTPCFYPGKKACISYFEQTKDFFDNKEAVDLYASHLLKLCLEQKG